MKRNISHTWAKFFAGSLIGVFVASFVGVTPGMYLGSMFVTMGIGFFACLVALVLLNLRGVSNSSVSITMGSLLHAIGLAVRERMDFTLHQIVFIAVTGVAISLALELLVPNKEETRWSRS